MKEFEEEKLNEVEEINENNEMVELSEDEENDVEGGDIVAGITERQIHVSCTTFGRSAKISLDYIKKELMGCGVKYDNYDNCISNIVNMIGGEIKKNYSNELVFGKTKDCITIDLKKKISLPKHVWIKGSVFNYPVVIGINFAA